MRVSAVTDTFADFTLDDHVDDLDTEFLIVDDETQTYTLEVVRREEPTEGESFMTRLEAEPELVDSILPFTFQVVDADGRRDRTYDDYPRYIYAWESTSNSG